MTFLLSRVFIEVVIRLTIAIALMMRASIIMIEKKRIDLFLPFFLLGLVFRFSAGFMFYGFFGLAGDVLMLSVFVFVTSLFYILWRAGK